MTRPRGPLPARVYWFRRAMVLVVLLVLVLGVARLVGGDADGGASARAKGDGDAVTPVAGDRREDPDAEASAPVEDARDESEPKPDKKKKRLPRPDGPCADSNVRVTPVVEDAHLNEPVEIVLELRTAESEACTWEVNPESVFVTISSPERQLWSSQHCGAVIPTEVVVPRRTKPDRVTVLWNGKESDLGCSPATEWVLTGTYTVTAIARGSVVPDEADFVLRDPRPPAPEPNRKRNRQT